MPPLAEVHPSLSQEFVSKQSKKETVLDYGPAPIPARYPVQLLVATQSVVALEDALVQLLDHSAECPVVLDATADLVELNNLLSRIKVAVSRGPAGRLFPRPMSLFFSILTTSPGDASWPHVCAGELGEQCCA